MENRQRRDRARRAAAIRAKKRRRQIIKTYIQIGLFALAAALAIFLIVKARGALTDGDPIAANSPAASLAPAQTDGPTPASAAPAATVSGETPVPTDTPDATAPTDAPDVAVPAETPVQADATAMPIPSDLVDFGALTENGLLLTGNALKEYMPYMVYTSKDSFTFAILGLDAERGYTRLLRTFPTAIGTGGKTRAGLYQIEKQYRWYSWALGGYTPYTSRFSASLRLHGTLCRTNGDFDSMYKSEYKEIGTVATQGCLRTTCEGAAWVYFNCGVGTYVQIANDEIYTSDPAPALPDGTSADPTNPESAEECEVPVTYFEVASEQISLAAGASASCAAQGVVPELNTSKGFLYQSENPAVATVDANGTISAHAAGATRVLVLSDDINKVHRIISVTVR